MTCPDENLLVDYAQGLLSEPERAAITTHLEGCSACRALLSEDSSTKSETMQDSPRSRDERNSAKAPAINVKALPQGTKVGRYVVLRPIGKGGMGVVYTAWDPELDRTVCLKLLRAELLKRLGDEAQTRLLREAQAMAQVAHPNVVGVHDVGTWDGGMFIAMEYVRGGNLREWLEKTPRTWREILRVFMEIGRGIEAAHALGLVHRDIKPLNLLVGDDGRARVTDFGLVLSTGGRGERPVIDEDIITNPGPLDMKLTRPGRVMGTPAYMPPEQLEGGTVDALSDQFSFCASLYEALFGVRAFAGETMEAVHLNIINGQVSAPAAGARKGVPGWLKVAVMRGLSADPSKRHPSMKALLDQLSRDPGRAQLRAAVFAGALVVAAAAIATPRIAERSRLQACDASQEALAGVWDDATREAISASFAKVGAPAAKSSWEAARGVVDAYARRWVEQRVEVCRATVSSRLPAETLWMQDTCLARSAQAIRATAALYRSPDREIVARALSMAHALPDLSLCGEVAVLTASPTPPPSDPGLRAEVEKARAELVALTAQREAGRFKDALAPMEALLPRVEKLGYRPLRAEVMHLKGLLQHDAGLVRESLDSFRDAAVEAEAVRHERLAARAWADVVFVAGRRLKRFDEAMLAVRLAEAALHRVGKDPSLEARLLTNRAGMVSAQGHPEEAAKLNQEAVAVYLAHVGENHPDTVRAYLQWGAMLQSQGRIAEAKDVLERALRAAEKSVGPHHPMVVSLLSSLARVAGKGDDHAAALSYFGRAVSLLEELGGKEHPDLAISLNNRALLLQELGRFDEGRIDLQRVVALTRKGFGEETTDLAEAHLNLALLELRSRNFAVARDHAEHALRIARARLPADHADFAFYDSTLAHILSAQGDTAQAQRLFEAAARIEEKGKAPASSAMADILTGLALVQVRQGNFAAAEKLARRALSIRIDQQADPADEAETRFVLAQALWSRGARAPARDEATRAVDGYRKSRQVRSLDLAELERWLTTRGSRPL